METIGKRHFRPTPCSGNLPRRQNHTNSLSYRRGRMQEGIRAVTGWQSGRGDVLVNDAGIPHAAPVAGKARSAGPETADPALARTGGRRKLGLRVALTGLVVVTVAITALLIHLTWSYTAQRN